ncbi:MAG: pyridoxamine 5'-phosphate oxidase family protein [Candidatus Latescibacteria bacterium]|nr:pyridoxamine 5'-phosphate oxidase family protein [Candidatus Latescibacterota bacterium]
MNDEKTVYFVTGKSSSKFRNLSGNPNVAFTADKDNADWKTIEAVQMQGKAVTVTEKEEIQKIMGMMFKKYPQMADFPPSPDIVFIKINFTEGYLLDYSKAFKHRDPVKY